VFGIGTGFLYTCTSYPILGRFHRFVFESHKVLRGFLGSMQLAYQRSREGTPCRLQCSVVVLARHGIFLPLLKSLSALKLTKCLNRGITLGSTILLNRLSSNTDGSSPQIRYEDIGQLSSVFVTLLTPLPPLRSLVTVTLTLFLFFQPRTLPNAYPPAIRRRLQSHLDCGRGLRRPSPPSIPLHTSGDAEQR
jgi:hypothetical protein